MKREIEDLDAARETLRPLGPAEAAGSGDEPGRGDDARIEAALIATGWSPPRAAKRLGLATSAVRFAEARLLARRLGEKAGSISAAAKALGMLRTTLTHKLRSHGIL